MRGLGPAVVYVVGPTGVKLLNFFFSSIQLYVLLSPHLCFISFLYVLGDDTTISWESFKQTKHLVLIHIRIKGEVGTVEHI